MKVVRVNVGFLTRKPSRLGRKVVVPIAFEGKVTRSVAAENAAVEPMSKKCVLPLTIRNAGFLPSFSSGMGKLDKQVNYSKSICTSFFYQLLSYDKCSISSNRFFNGNRQLAAVRYKKTDYFKLHRYVKHFCISFYLFSASTRDRSLYLYLGIA